MVGQEMELHPIYGAIPQDGEFVRRGDVLGLSTDSREVILAPVSGWVRIIRTPEETHGSEACRLLVQILQAPQEETHALISRTA